MLLLAEQSFKQLLRQGKLESFTYGPGLSAGETASSRDKAEHDITHSHSFIHALGMGNNPDYHNLQLCKDK